MIDIKKIQLGKNKKPNIFSEIAEEAAHSIKYTNGQYEKKTNKSTQIRKYYDELSMWNDKVNLATSKEERSRLFDEYIPFIYMLKAKVAYAEGRKSNGTTLVNRNFSQILNRCIDQIIDPETLKEAKLFMEAVLAFCKLEEVKNKG